jgi:hypothetical protein
VYFWGEYDIEDYMLPDRDLFDTEVFVVNGTCEYTVGHYRTGYSTIYITIEKDGKEETCGWIDYEVIDNK